MKAVEVDISSVLLFHPSMNLLLARLAMNSARTFRHTDYLGGCNGSRIRFHLDWDINKGLDEAVRFLEPAKEKYHDSLSWADFIVLAGNVAVKNLGAPQDLPFVGGRTDANDGSGWNALVYMNAAFPKSIDEIVQRNKLRGLSNKEYVALAFPFYPTIDLLKKLIASNEHEPHGDKDMLAVSLRHGPFFRRWVEHYINAGDEEYKYDFASTWTKIMNIDRFSGPVQNIALTNTDAQSRL
jgi:Peroxidase